MHIGASPNDARGRRCRPTIRGLQILLMADKTHCGDCDLSLRVAHRQCPFGRPICALTEHVSSARAPVDFRCRQACHDVRQRAVSFGMFASALCQDLPRHIVLCTERPLDGIVPRFSTCASDLRRPPYVGNASYGITIRPATQTTPSAKRSLALPGAPFKFMERWLHGALCQQNARPPIQMLEIKPARHKAARGSPCEPRCNIHRGSTPLGPNQIGR